MGPTSRQWQRGGPAGLVAMTAALCVLSACGSSGSKSGGGAANAPNAAASAPQAGSATTGGSAQAAGGAVCSKIPAGPIKIGQILPLTGPAAANGKLQKAGTAVDADYLNAHGGICGHQVTLVNSDDKGDPATSLSQARQLVASGVTIVWNDSFGASQNLIQPYLMKNHVLLVDETSVLANFDPKTNPTAFSIGPSSAQLAKAMVGWATSHSEGGAVGLIGDGTPFSTELTGLVTTQAKPAGMKIVKAVSYSPTAIDVTPQLLQEKQAGVTTLMPTGFTGITALVAGLKQIGWSPTLISWGGLAAYGTSESQVAPTSVDGCTAHLIPGVSAQPVLTAQNNALAGGTAKVIGVTPATAEFILEYNVLTVIQHAVETANSLDGQKLAAAIEATSSLATNVPGITLSFSPTNHFGSPDSETTECALKFGMYDLLYATK